MRSFIGVVGIGCLGLLGCSGGAASAGEEGAGPGLVMLDAEARAAGFSLVTAGGAKVAPVAPVELEGDVTLVGPGQRIPLSGAPGELLVVTGKRGLLVPHTLSTEVDADAVRVDGSEHSVRNLADALHARVSGAGPWELRAPGLVASLAHEAALDEGVTSIETLAAGQAAQATPAQATPAGTAANADEIRLFSAADPRFAGLASLGARSPVCGDPAVGTWVSLPQHFGSWHVFTLHVEPGQTPEQLTGSVNAHVWSGDEAEEAPSTCADHDLDIRVSMPATGVRASDGTMRFDAGPWKLDQASCTGSDWGYLPDHFSGLAEGGAIRSVNNDGGYYVNAPVGFERVSCE